MSIETQQGPGFWPTVRILLAATRKRSAGRRERQRQLLNTRSDGKATDWGAVTHAFFILFMLFVNGGAAHCLLLAVESAQRVEVERTGKIVVSSSFYREVKDFTEGTSYLRSGHTQLDYSSEAKSISEKYGGSEAAIEQRLRDAVANRGTLDLVPTKSASPGLSGLASTGRLPALAGFLMLLWWAMMLTFQGEGLEMDVQRRRHPMWEWLFSHPVPPGAVFLSEMLSPIAANPMYWGGPLFAGFLYSFAYGAPGGLLAAPLIGVPVTIAAACLGKALEIAILLRCSPRSRGAIIGLMSWAGYTSLMFFVIGLFYVPRIIAATANLLSFATRIPWPWLGLFIGARPDGSFSFLFGMITCWAAAGLTIAGSVWFSLWGTQRGLAGNFSSEVARPSDARKPPRFGSEPLYRKEFLWFIRDRSAIVQCLLIPISVAGFQLFNLRGLLVHAQKEWNYLSGVAIFFGTYFLWILGPKSLQSEGSALWIALTWPRGLESLLKAKAWLWSMISTGLVAIVLAYAAINFPAAIWKIALVGLGWYLFSRSMAEKSVTLVTITSSSGETEKVPKGRLWAAQLGMLTFAIGIVTAQWQLAIIGIVYSYLTAAAMWQNFRARLPYLYDPWSERLPPAPTLMHAMISISVLVEISALISIPFLLILGRENLAAGQAVGYGISAIVVSVFVSNFLRDRDVNPPDVWCWLPAGQKLEECESWSRRYGIADRAAVGSLMLGAGGGLALGLFGRGYQYVLLQIPATSELIHKAQQQMNGIADFRFWYGVMAVGFAPFAEEYLFRGLLFRALDREWGGWIAVAGSAAFFAIYHPPLSWLPVWMLGAANAVLFKKTRRLAPAVVLHMVYNAIVLS